MIKRANRESRPIPLPTLLGRCVVRLIELPPHFVITPRRPRGVAVATTAAPETRLADLHARGNHPLSTPIPQDQLERFSSFETHPSRLLDLHSV